MLLFYSSQLFHKGIRTDGYTGSVNNDLEAPQAKLNTEMGIETAWVHPMIPVQRIILSMWTAWGGKRRRRQADVTSAASMGV